MPVLEPVSVAALEVIVDCGLATVNFAAGILEAAMEPSTIFPRLDKMLAGLTLEDAFSCVLPVGYKESNVLVGTEYKVPGMGAGQYPARSSGEDE